VKSVFDEYSDKYTSSSTICRDDATIMGPKIGVPEQHETVLVWEHGCLVIHDALERSMPTWRRGIDTMFSRFVAKAPRWFASASDQAKFKGAAAKLRTSFGFLLDEAFPHVSMGFLDLSQDPPELTQEALDVADGADDANVARGSFPVYLAAFGKLL